MRKKEITRTVYFTADGREYSSEKDAVKHERELAQELDPQLLAIVLSEECDSLQEIGGCANCPFFNESSHCTLNDRYPWEWHTKISQ